MDKKSSSADTTTLSASSIQNTSQLIENDKDVQSYIYQQISEFENYVTPETLILVMARDPYENTEEDSEVITERSGLHRIAIVLKENEASIESESISTDVYAAIKQAKEQLINRLIEIQDEVESPQERLQAIQQASSNGQIH